MQKSDPDEQVYHYIGNYIVFKVKNKDDEQGGKNKKKVSHLPPVIIRGKKGIDVYKKKSRGRFNKRVLPADRRMTLPAFSSLERKAYQRDRLIPGKNMSAGRASQPINRYGSAIGKTINDDIAKTADRKPEYKNKK